MILTIDEVRKEFSEYLSNRVTEKKSLDAAFMHVATHCFTRGVDSLLGEQKSLVKIANRPIPKSRSSYAEGVEMGRILMARALLVKLGLEDQVDVQTELEV